MMKEMIGFLALKNGADEETLFSKNEILYGIIKTTQCDQDKAESVFKKMIDLGLNVCKKIPTEFYVPLGQQDTYYLMKFGIMRNYIPEKEEK